MIKINLLAEGKRPTAVRRVKPASFFESPNIALWVLLAAFVLVGVLPAAAWWWQKRLAISHNRDQIAEAQREVDELAPIIREVEEYKAKQAELEHKIQVITDLRLNQKGPVRLMDAISRALPELLWLDRLDMRGNTISLAGRAFNTNAVAAFMDNLDKVPEFQEPILRDTQQGRGSVYSFSITFNFSFKPTPAPAPAATGAAAPPKAAPAAPAPAPAAGDLADEAGG